MGHQVQLLVRDRTGPVDQGVVEVEEQGPHGHHLPDGEGERPTLSKTADVVLRCERRFAIAADGVSAGWVPQSLDGTSRVAAAEGNVAEHEVTVDAD